ncbi:hypothetical protein HAX54_034440 [Datura stramonium]|uniref:Uncharacterized protein n=1 Tax=Datura stramonium TaxID=4076 RepID=A0ABS8VF51_DATST|nr:hypothetical protein [Datura stramonium]
MEMEQQLEWNEAQKIEINVDLVAAAKQHIEFLATLDRNRWLNEGPGLNIAIYRYYSCWLPLLAKHSDCPFFEGPLVVPLDCEWVWHCHRLNPVRYKTDCEQLYGRILDNHNIVSSVKGISKMETEETWKHFYPNEPYDLDSARALSDNNPAQILKSEKCSNYDLVSAVKRQSPFFYQVSRPHMTSEIYLKGAVARYKGFLHLIRRIRERSIESFSVPTYDIDLIWHTHQLHPISYCKDLVDIMGKVLNHDDTDSDRTKGKKLDTGFSGTTKFWEEMYGLRYWRAGAMYRGNAPSPLRICPYPSNPVSKKTDTFHADHKIIHLPEMKVLEVMLEIIGIRNLPEGHKGSFFVSFSKSQPDRIFNAKKKLTIFSESGEKQVAYFQCEPCGHLLLELMSQSSHDLPISKSVKVIGSTALSLEDLTLPDSQLTMEKWLESAKNWTRVTDDAGDEIIRLQMRNSKKSKRTSDSPLQKELIGINKDGETHTLAKLVGKEWLLLDSRWSLQFQTCSGDDGYLLELIGGSRTVKFFPCQKLDYEHKHCAKRRNQDDFMTAIEFSSEHPYGRALALLDLKCGVINVKEEWLLLPGIITAFILGDILRKEGDSSVLSIGNNLKDQNTSTEETNACNE